MENRVWTKDEIRAMLTTNDRAIFRGIVAIFHKQTADEQVRNETNQHNAIGFTGADAGILSSFAKQVIGWNRRHRTSARL